VEDNEEIDVLPIIRANKLVGLYDLPKLDKLKQHKRVLYWEKIESLVIRDVLNICIS
jgi:hypothetical protein